LLNYDYKESCRVGILPTDTLYGLVGSALSKKAVPLVAPSANLEGEPPAKTIKEAKKYFGPAIHLNSN